MCGKANGLLSQSFVGPWASSGMRNCEYRISKCDELCKLCHRSLPTLDFDEHRILRNGMSQQRRHNGPVHRPAGMLRLLSKLVTNNIDQSFATFVTFVIRSANKVSSSFDLFHAVALCAYRRIL